MPGIKHIIIAGFLVISFIEIAKITISNQLKTDKMSTLKKSKAKGKNFLFIRQGMIRKSIPASEVIDNTGKILNEDAVKTTYEGKDYYHLEFDEIENVTITRVMIHEEESEAKKAKWEVLSIDCENTEGKFCLQMNFSSNEARDFLKRLPNMEVGNPVTIKVFAIENANKKVMTYCVIYQHDKKIEHKFNKENPLPAWEEVKIGAGTPQEKTIWDSTKEQLALKEVIAGFEKTAADFFELKQSEKEKPNDDFLKELNNMPVAETTEEIQPDLEKIGTETSGYLEAAAKSPEKVAKKKK